MTRFSILFAAAALFAGCSTPPLAMDANHPASASAPEAFTPTARSTLRPDANTLHTRELLAQREQQAKAAESETPVDDVNPSPNAPRTSPAPMKDMGGMKDMKGMNHENH
jgi:hypothetical protein